MTKKKSKSAFKDIMMAQTTMHSSTDDIIAELTNRIQKKLTGIDVYQTILTEISTEQLMDELSERSKVINQILSESSRRKEIP